MQHAIEIMVVDKKEKDIPPGLYRLIRSKKVSKRSVFLIIISIFLVILGIFGVYFVDRYVALREKTELARDVSTPYFPKEVVQSQKEQEKPIIVVESDTQKEVNQPQKEKTAKKTVITQRSIPHITKKTVIPKSAPLVSAPKSEARVSEKQSEEKILDPSTIEFKGADYLYRARDYELKGLYKEAIGEYKDYMKASGTEDPRILNKIVALYILVGDLSSASYYADVALNIKPEDPKILLNYGVIRVKKGEYELAEDVFKKVLRLEPENTKALFNLALLKELKGENEEALRLYEKLHVLGNASGVEGLQRLRNQK